MNCPPLTNYGCISCFQYFGCKQFRFCSTFFIFTGGPAQLEKLEKRVFLKIHLEKLEIYIFSLKSVGKTGFFSYTKVSLRVSI